MELSGTILAGDNYEPVEGRVVVEDGEIAAVEEGSTGSNDIVCPAFVNAHTHIGDSIAKEAGRGLSLEKLVAPPDGPKHRLLREASMNDSERAIASTVSLREASRRRRCLRPSGGATSFSSESPRPASLAMESPM